MLILLHRHHLRLIDLDALGAVLVGHGELLEAVSVHLVAALETRIKTLVVGFYQLRAERAPRGQFWRVVMQMGHVHTHTSIAKVAMEEVLSPASLADSAPVAVENTL